MAEVGILDNLVTLVEKQETMDADFNISRFQRFLYLVKTLGSRQYFKVFVLTLLDVVDDVVGIDAMVHTEQIIVLVFGVFSFTDDNRSVWLYDN